MRLLRFSVLIWTLLFNQLEASEEGGSGQSFGDWTEYCEKVPDSSDICNISQTLTRQGSQQLLLSIRINYVPGKKEPLVFATLPLGGLLTYTPQLKVEGAEPLKMAYQFCDISGCTTIAIITDEMVAALKSKQQAVVQYVNIERKAVGIPVSLKGFSKGLKKLTDLKNKQ